MAEPLREPGPTVAVLLAGGSADDPLARRFGVASKAHLPYQGLPLVQRVLDALQGSTSVDLAVYVGVPPAGAAQRSAAVVPAGERLADSLALGLGAALTFAPARLLLVTADLPWLTAAGIDRFVQRAPAADLVYPVVERNTMTQQFPGQRRTFVRIKDGSFTGGNVLLLLPRSVGHLLPFVERATRARKNPLALSALFGPAVIWGLLRGSLRITELERRVSLLLGADARAFISDDGGLAADLDRTEQLTTLIERPAPSHRPEEVA